MDDVDRLFQCFKCGISPPESARRERKRFKSKLKSENPLASSSPGSAELRSKDSSNAELCPDEQGSTSSVRANKVVQKIKMSPVLFYGSPSGVPPKRPSSLLRLLREIRVDLAEQHKLKESKKIWATFPRQEEAMKFAKEHAQVRIFSYQDHFKGQRRFLVATYPEFWRRYAGMDPMLRHHYEVIQEGLPCHLYFDLEFSKKHNNNPEKNGDVMVDLLISVVFEVLRDKYSIQGNLEWVVELDSSTEEKFSRHLIVRVPGAAFKDNSHVGSFVAEVCTSAKATDKRYEKLFVTKDSSLPESASHIFVDTAVYSRNRCFRLALSSKAGKTAVLLPTKRFMCKDMNEEEMFMASLICKMDDDCDKLLVCKMELDCAKTLRFDTEKINANFKRHREFALNPCTYNNSSASAAYIMGKSPFPELDKFIESVASSTGTVPGQIRSWYWFSEHGLMVYSMSRNRYCERIGREHKSNHVIYVVDLYRAVYYQKCHDPDCAGYRSANRLVPDDAIPHLSAFYDSGQRQITTAHPAESMGSLLYSSNENTVESSPMDSWWLEATRVANRIESWPKTLEIDMKESSEEDDDEEWWMAVENTLQQTDVPAVL